MVCMICLICMVCMVCMFCVVCGSFNPSKQSSSVGIDMLNLRYLPKKELLVGWFVRLSIAKDWSTSSYLTKVDRLYWLNFTWTTYVFVAFPLRPQVHFVPAFIGTSRWFVGSSKISIREGMSIILTCRIQHRATGETFFGKDYGYLMGRSVL